MIQVIPAIIPEDFENLEFELSKVRGKAKRVQIDLTDGIYTPNTSWPFVDDERFEKIVSQEEGMPFEGNGTGRNVESLSPRINPNERPILPFFSLS